MSGGGLLMGGTLTIHRHLVSALLPSTALLLWGVERWGVGFGCWWARCWVSEGTGRCCGGFFGCRSRCTPACGLGVAGGWLLFENCTVDASICGQVFKGARWMPWHQEPMKDVGGRDRPRGAVNRAVIRGCPNGETRQSSWAVTRT